MKARITQLNDLVNVLGIATCRRDTYISAPPVACGNHQPRVWLCIWFRVSSHVIAALRCDRRAIATTRLHIPLCLDRFVRCVLWKG
jgi:hypothetical protein